MGPARAFDALGGPGRWIAGACALEAAPGALAKIPQPLVVVGEFFLREQARARLQQPLLAAGYAVQELDFSGECTRQGAAALARSLKDAQGGAVLALGGGKCMDTCKLAAASEGLPVIAVPTSAATCACATSVAVLYAPDGSYEDTVELDQAPCMVFVDTGLISPDRRLLAAGLVDAAAKWLEWQALPPASRRGFGAEAGLALARRAWEIAREGFSEGPGCRWDLENCLEASLVLAAQASCLGSAPAAVAHSLCNALSWRADCRGLLHGELVGLGLLVQDRILEMRGKTPEDSDRRAAWLGGLGMPVRLPAPLGSAERQALALRALGPGESALDLAPACSPGELARALDAIQ